MSPSANNTGEVFDVAVIGAGVVGCAIARRFTLEGARTIVLEKGHDILDGASKSNSAILHTGFDAPPESREARCIQAGYQEYERIRGALNLPLDRCGALVLAWTEEQEARLPTLMQQARDNAVDDIKLLSRSETVGLEPNLATQVRASFRVPREALIDPWSAPHAYLEQALLNGAMLKRNCAVRAGEFDGQQWHLETSHGTIHTKFVINAAGLFGDHIDKALLGRTDFEIRPRKGQFIVFDKTAARLSRHILLPVPTETTKGIVVCRTIWGNLLVGPTAEEQSDRETAELVPEPLDYLHQKGIEILPALATEDITAFYAGLRPASGQKEYQIRAHAGHNMITVGAIRSTGLSAALGIAKYVFDLGQEAGLQCTPLVDPVHQPIENMSEDLERDWQRPGNGGIICHCERVTRREIEVAMSGPLAPNSLAGLKRRTRVTMGRCQGFYCTAALAECTKGKLTHPIAGARHDD